MCKGRKGGTSVSVYLSGRSAMQASSPLSCFSITCHGPGYSRNTDPL